MWPFKRKPAELHNYIVKLSSNHSYSVIATDLWYREGLIQFWNSREQRTVLLINLKEVSEIKQYKKGCLLLPNTIQEHK